MTYWLTDEEREMEAFLTQEPPPITPVEARFRRHHFVSQSKGRSKGAGRTRRAEPYVRTRLAEVTLIADTHEPERPQRWQNDRDFPYDVKATEVYDNPLAESEKLRREIGQLEG